MNGVQDWTMALSSSLQLVWDKTIGFLPEIIAALIVIIIGFIVARGLKLLVEKIVDALRIDALLESVGFSKVLSRAKLSLKTGKLLGEIVYWILIIAFLLAAANILHLDAVSDFLNEVLLYLPNLLVAVIILVITFLFARFMKELVRHSSWAANLKEAGLVGNITWWIVVIFGCLSALYQLKIASNLINIIIGGVVVMIALAGGLAFGLAGKDYVKEIIEGIRQDIKEE